MDSERPGLLNPELITDHVYRVLELIQSADSVVHVPLSDPLWSVDDLWREQATDPQELLQQLFDKIHTTGLILSTSRSFGLVPNSGNFAAYVGSLIEGCKYHHHQDHTFLKRTQESLVRWMIDIVGYPSEADGYMTAGASSATVAVMATVREKELPDHSTYNRSVIYVSARTNICVVRSSRVVGLENCQVHVVGGDISQELSSHLLEQAIIQDKQAGLVPLLIVATAGTTECGYVDPLYDIADVASRHNIWLHVDAAYGGSYMLSMKTKHMFTGIEKADSVVIDTHKGFSQPYAASILLFKRGSCAHCFQDDGGQYGVVNNPLEKHWVSRSFPVWFSFKVFGLDTFRGDIEKQLNLASYFHQNISTLPDIVTMEPQLSIVCFRLKSDNIQIGNDRTKRLLHGITEDGCLHLTSTSIDGIFWLRLCVTSLKNNLKATMYCISAIKRQIFMKTSSNNLQYLWRKDFEKMKRHEAKCNLLEDKIVTKFAGIISHNCIDNCKIDVQTDISNCESSDDKYNGVLCPETKLTSEDMERYWKTISHSFLKDDAVSTLRNIGNISSFLGMLTNTLSVRHAWSQGAVGLEYSIIQWMAGQCCLPGTSGGVITADCRTSCLLALLAAKQSHKLSENHKPVVYTTLGGLQECRTTCTLAGLGHSLFRVLEEDEKGFIDVSMFELVLQEDKGRFDLYPWVVMNFIEDKIADNTRRLSALCRSYGVSLHVQLGVKPSRLLWTHPDKMNALSGVSSVTLELSKALHVHTASSVILVRDSTHLKQTMDPGLSAAYLTAAKENEDVFDPFNYCFDMSRPARVIPIWLTVSGLGFKRLRELLFKSAG